jgi:hypothetical protein
MTRGWGAIRISFSLCITKSSVRQVGAPGSLSTVWWTRQIVPSAVPYIGFCWNRFCADGGCVVRILLLSGNAMAFDDQRAAGIGKMQN